MANKKEEIRLCKGCKTYKPISKFQQYVTMKGKVLRRRQCSNCRKRKPYSKEKRDKFYKAAKERRIRIKKELVKQLGGICFICGKEYPICCFDFHHKGGTLKKTEISKLIALQSKEKQLYEEIKKCMLVCSNCHRIIHWGGELKSQI